MKAVPELQLEAYTNAALRSERARLVCMLAAFTVFVLIGIFRVIVPHAGAERLGVILIAVMIPFIAYEALALRAVMRRISGGGALAPQLRRITSVVECAMPLTAMTVIMLLTEANRYTLLVSPGYAMILVIIAISPLALDPSLSLLTGIVGTVGYLAVVLFVVVGADDPGPHPLAMYFMLTSMLVVATAAIVFVTTQVRGYVIAAVREMETKRRHDQMQRDLELARDIQRGLLPESTPALPGYDLAAMSRSAELAGGDYYDWQVIAKGRVVISLADVTGHGVGPALVTAACRAYLRAMIDDEPAHLELMSRVNHLLHEDLPSGRFVTFALIDIDSAKHEGVFVSAGHGPTMWMKGGDGSASSIDAQGLPLGIVPDQEWDEVYRVSFDPGDILILFSDGFFEAQGAGDELFGLDRLQEVVRTNRTASAEVILQRMDEAVTQWSEGRLQQDDMTAIVIKRLAG